MTCAWVWRDSFTCMHNACICVTWLIHACVITHLYVWHHLRAWHQFLYPPSKLRNCRRLTCVNLLLHMRNVIHSYRPRMEKSHSKRHEPIFGLVISIVMVLNARQKILLVQISWSTISKWWVDSKKYSEQVFLEVSEVEMVHNNLYPPVKFNGFTTHWADFSRKECD